MNKSGYILAIDIGGTWIKGSSFTLGEIIENSSSLPELIKCVRKVKSPMHKGASTADLSNAIQELAKSLDMPDKPLAIGISTAGIVSYDGNRLEKSAEHLAVLRDNTWKESVQKDFSCPVSLINDADAAMAGAALKGHLEGNARIALMAIGTGLGFAVSANGRRWRPGHQLTLLGSIRTPAGSYDEIASASRLAAKIPSGNLAELLASPEHKTIRDAYFKGLSEIIVSSAIIYSLDRILLSGGLADAANEAGFDLKEEILKYIPSCPPELDRIPELRVLEAGNKFQLAGAAMLAAGDYAASQTKVLEAGKTSIPLSEEPLKPEIEFTSLKAEETVREFLSAELSASESLMENCGKIAEAASLMADSLKKGGRLIYLGAGTSGRLAALDCVELPCTFGLPPEKAIALIAGGNADAAIEIEFKKEEDASSIPELLIMNLTEADTVIGISASGSAYYVRSGLAFAKLKKANTVLLSESANNFTDASGCDLLIEMHSGLELIAGSTRLKAGTATKKILNALSSTAMIMLGKTAGSYMIDMQCLNEKLKRRAVSIIKRLHGKGEGEARKLLEENAYNLRRTLETIRGYGKTS